MNVSSAASRSPAGDRGRRSAARRRAAGSRAASRAAARRTLVRRRAGRCRVVSSAAPSAQRPPYEWPNDVDRRARLARGHRLGDRGHVLELALDRVRRRIAGRAAAAPVDRVQANASASTGPRTGRRVVGGRAVDEDERRPLAGREDRDRRAVGRWTTIARWRAHVTAASGRARPVDPPRCPTVAAAGDDEPMALVEAPGAVVDLESVQLETARPPLLRELDQPAADSRARARPGRRTAARSRRRRGPSSRRPGRRGLGDPRLHQGTTSSASQPPHLLVGVGEREVVGGVNAAR